MTPSNPKPFVKVIGRSGPVTVITVLYGFVTPKRYMHESRETQKRARQLDLSKPAPRIRTESEDYYDHDELRKPRRRPRSKTQAREI